MLSVRILTPEGTLFEGDVDSLTLPGSLGSFTVLDRHAPIISALERGKVICKSANGMDEFNVNTGFASVDNNTVSVCIEV